MFRDNRKCKYFYCDDTDKDPIKYGWMCDGWADCYNLRDERFCSLRKSGSQIKHHTKVKQGMYLARKTFY